MSTQNLIDDFQETEFIGGDLGPGRGHNRKPRVLIADNSASALRTTQEFFDDEGVDTIPLQSREATKLVILFNIRTLDAIVLDGRLTSDDEPRDRSGYDLALETFGRYEDCPPIIIYSMYDDRSQFDIDWNVIPFVLKDQGREVLVNTVRERIKRRRLDPHSGAPRSADIRADLSPPCIILEAPGDHAYQLSTALKRYDIQAYTCPSLSALTEAAPYLPPAMYIIDFGACGREEGIKAISFLKEVSDPFMPAYVAALGDGDECGYDAAQAGADFFKARESAKTDALELILRMSQHKMELERATAASAQSQLAAIRYQELIRHLTEIRESRAHGMAAPIKTIELALDGPFLLPEEQLVLTSLYTQMLSVGEGDADTGTIDLCLEGAKILANGRAQRTDVHEWVERATQHSPDFTLAWFKEEFLEDRYEDDGEDDDN